MPPKNLGSRESPNPTHGCPAAVDLVPILIRNDDSLLRNEDAWHSSLLYTEFQFQRATHVCDGIGKRANARATQSARFIFQIMSFGYLHCFLVRSCFAIAIRLCVPMCVYCVYCIWLFFFFFLFLLLEKLNLYLCVHDWRSNCATVSQFIALFGKVKALLICNDGFEFRFRSQGNGCSY